MDELKLLLEARDRNLTRSIDYDLKVLTLMFGIAVAWGVVLKAEGGVLKDGQRELIEVILTVAGLIISIAWHSRRTILWQIEDRIIAAIAEISKDRPEAARMATAVVPFPRTGPGAICLRQGGYLAIMIFFGLTGYAAYDLTKIDFTQILQ